MPSTKRNEADEFVKIIREQLLQDGTLSCSDNKLKDILRESIQELPEGGLKVALCDNFEEYFGQLKSKSIEDAWSFNALTPRGLKDCLQALKVSPYTEEKCSTYKALLTSNPSAVHRAAILHQWVMSAASCSVKHCLCALQQSSLLIGTAPGAPGQWLMVCVEAYTQIFNRITKGTVDEEQTRAVVESLLNAILLGHLRSKQHGQSSDVAVDDALAALVSLYIDVALMSPGPKVSAKASADQAASLVMIVLGHSQELCLDAVLQTMVSTKKPGSLFPLMRHLLSLCEANPSPRLYAKYLCCFHRAMHQSHSVQSDIIAVERLFSKIAPPSQFKQWLWNMNPSLCDAMGLQQSWPLAKTVAHLSAELSEESIEGLLDAVCGADSLTNQKELDYGVTSNEVGPQVVGEDAEYFMDTAGDPVEEIDEKTISNTVTDLITKLDFDPDGDKEVPCSKDLGYVLDRAGDGEECVPHGDMDSPGSVEEMKDGEASLEADLREVQSDKAEEEMLEVSSDVPSRSVVGVVNSGLSQTATPVSSTRTAASVEATGEMRAVQGSVRKRHSAVVRCITPKLVVSPVKMSSSVRSKARNIVVVEEEQEEEGSHLDEAVAKFSDNRCNEDQVMDQKEESTHKNMNTEAAIDGVTESGITSTALKATLSGNSKDITDDNEPAHASSVTRKRTSSTPANTGKRNKVDASAKKSTRGVTVQTPILLRSSARTRRTLGAENIDEQQPNDSVQSGSMLPSLVEAEEDSVGNCSSEQSGVGNATAAPPPPPTMSQAEETAEDTVCEDSDVSPYLPRTRRKKTIVTTAASVDRRKTSAKSTKSTSADVEAGDEPDTRHAKVVMGRPSPIMLRSLAAKPARGKEDVAGSEAPGLSKSSETPLAVRSRKNEESVAFSLPVRRSSRRV